MGAGFEQLDWAETPMGVISLRRRVEPNRGVDVYEAKLDDAYLMSSLFTVAEVELARLGLAAVAGHELDVVVGGLGLGYSACTVLEDPRVRSLTVVEALPEVIAWHRDGLLPEAAALTRDHRVRLVEGDFFALAAGGDGGFAGPTGGDVDVILVDIDHSPRHLLDPAHAPFYTRAGIAALAGHLHPGGVFALWSDDPPDDAYLADLRSVFDQATAHVVTFPNFLTGGESSNTVYIGT